MSNESLVGIGITVVVEIVALSVAWGIMSERLRKVAEEVATKIAREEFEAGMKRLDELHRDLREIRDLLLKVLTREAA